MAKVEEKIELLVEPKVEQLGYELYDVEYVKEGKDYYLRVYINSNKGIDLNDCEKVSNEINQLIDEADFIQEQYFLEVSSTGIERVLRKDKHLDKSIGENVKISLYKNIEGKKQYEGILKRFNKESVMLEVEEKELEFERKNISQIKTIYNWE